MDNAKVVHDPEHRVFELVVDNGDIAGYAEYRPANGAMAITHVIVEPRYGGRGFGSKLAKAALDEAKDRGLEVLPLCWFVREQLKLHPDYIDLVPEGERRRFGLVA